jgi:hypothetical protein
MAETAAAPEALPMAEISMGSSSREAKRLRH